MSSTTRTEDITRLLREEVLRGQYRPGERLPSERELAARFQTTRGVARVALKKLEQLGVARVEPGGARVQPLAEASLDAIGHLLELDDRPDPKLVDQVLEVLGALVAGGFRTTLERAQPEDLARAELLIQKMRRADLEQAQVFSLLHELMHTMMEANDNVVMHIVRRTLRAELFGSLRPIHETLPVNPETGRPNPPSSRMVEDLPQIAPHVDALAAAVEQRDGLAAYEAVHQLWGLLRQNVRKALNGVAS
jgi:DNA-binding FadR family transcriptional regulator